MYVRCEVEIDSGNAALAEDPEGETARLLRETAERITAGHGSGVLLDSNGNRVGRFYFHVEPD